MPRTALKYLLSFTVIFITFNLLNCAELAAQCQACKSTVETNLASGGTFGLGLNKGILYLLVMPYIMIMSVAVIWYYKFRTTRK